MAERPARTLTAVLERVPVQSRWETEHWELAGVAPDGAVEAPAEASARERWRLFPGLEVALYRDEAEGYYLNASSEEPSVFVSLREDEATGEPYAFQATLSYNEAARWMDGGEKVERALAWPELAEWLAQWVQANYRPEPKERKRPKSFRSKEGRLRREEPT